MAASIPSSARLQAIGSKTLALAMERQRLLSISPPSRSILTPASGSTGSTSSVSQIVKNLATLREGVLSIENAQGSTKQTESLREQYENILSVLGEEDVAAAGVPRYVVFALFRLVGGFTLLVLRLIIHQFTAGSYAESGAFAACPFVATAASLPFQG